MTEMTMEQALDKMVEGFEAQGWKRSVESTLCKYRSSGGLRCAAGHLIPDDKYDPRFEGVSIRASVQSFGVGARGREEFPDYEDGDYPVCMAIGLKFGSELFDFVKDMQSFHDCSLDGQFNKKSFLLRASTHNVDMTKYEGQF